MGADAVEIRNDFAGNAILDGTPARRIRQLAEAARVLSIKALRRFEDWRAPRPTEAAALADFAHVSAFIEGLGNGTALAPSGRDGLPALALAEATVRSVAVGAR